MKHLHWELLLLPIASVVLGLYLILRPWSATTAICALIGWIILLAGVGGAVNAVLFQRATLVSDPLLPLSVSGIVVGLFFITRPTTLIEIVGLVICVFLMLQGMLNVQAAVQRYRWGDRLWWLPLAVGAICIVLGLFALFAPGTSTTMMMRLVGIMLLSSGITNLLAVLLAKE